MGAGVAERNDEDVDAVADAVDVELRPADGHGGEVGGGANPEFHG